MTHFNLLHPQPFYPSYSRDTLETSIRPTLTPVFYPKELGGLPAVRPVVYILRVVGIPEGSCEVHWLLLSKIHRINIPN